MQWNAEKLEDTSNDKLSPILAPFVPAGPSTTGDWNRYESYRINSTSIPPATNTTCTAMTVLNVALPSVNSLTRVSTFLADAKSFNSSTSRVTSDLGELQHMVNESVDCRTSLARWLTQTAKAPRVEALSTGVDKAIIGLGGDSTRHCPQLSRSPPDYAFNISNSVLPAESTLLMSMLSSNKDFRAESGTAITEGYASPVLEKATTSAENDLSDEGSRECPVCGKDMLETWDGEWACEDEAVIEA